MNSSSNSEQRSEIVMSRDNMEEDILFATDEYQLLIIFSAGVWELVLEHLDNDDLRKLCNSSPFFRKRLFLKRKLFLFRKTLRWLAPYLFKSEEEEGSSSSILDCRVVCQAWNTGVDYYFKDGIEAMEFTDYATNQKEICTLDNAQRKYFSNINTGQRTEYFLRQFETQPASSKLRNPFISREVVIHYVESSDQNNNYMNTITTLLRRHGKHIRNLEIQFGFRNELVSGETWYSALNLWLGHVGELRDLKIKGTSNNNLNYNRPIFSFTKFQNLETLKLDILPPSILENFILRNCPSLIVLELRQEIPIFEDNLMINLADFPKLKQLCAKISSRDQMLNLLGFFGKWPLQIIELHHCKEYSDIAHLECFENLKICANNWGNTLKDLKLCLPSENTAEEKETYLRESANLRLNFSCLENFELEVTSPIHLDFLLNAKNSLEIVTIKTYGESSLSGQVALEGAVVVDTNSQIVQFLGYEHRMYESNIWTMFPELHYMGTRTSRFGKLRVFTR